MKVPVLLAVMAVVSGCKPLRTQRSQSRIRACESPVARIPGHELTDSLSGAAQVWL